MDASFPSDTEDGKLIEAGRGDVSATPGRQVMLSLSLLGTLETEIDDWNIGATIGWSSSTVIVVIGVIGIGRTSKFSSGCCGMPCTSL